MPSFLSDTRADRELTKHDEYNDSSLLRSQRFAAMMAAPGAAYYYRKHIESRLLWSTPACRYHAAAVTRLLDVDFDGGLRKIPRTRRQPRAMPTFRARAPAMATLSHFQHGYLLPYRSVGHQFSPASECEDERLDAI